MTHPKTMKAVTRFAYGPPENLSITEWPTPTPKDNEILVRVQATTVNRTDCGVLTGMPLVFRFFIGFKPRFAIIGTDFAGQVVAKGKNVSTFEIGDAVYGFMDNGLSSQAQYVAVSVDKPVLKIPAGLTCEQAVASLEGAHYAYYFLRKVDLKAGQKVMVNGATGAIGSAVVQLLKYLGVWVTATCPTDYVSVIKGLGADKVIDYQKEDFIKDADTYDFVFDTVGKSTFGKCRRLLKPGGVYISSELGPYWQNPLLSLVSLVKPGRKVKFPIPFEIQKSMAFIKELLEKNAFKPLIDRSYHFEQAREAYAYVASGQKKGNVILRFD